MGVIRECGHLWANREQVKGAGSAQVGFQDFLNGLSKAAIGWRCRQERHHCDWNLPITHAGDVDAQPLGRCGGGDKTNQEGAGRAPKI